MVEWKKVEDPPETTPGTWSIEVVVVSNYGNVYSLSYYNGGTGGVWQRPALFNDGEQVELWIKKPELE